MFDNNYDKNEGESVWGHVLDGVATGGATGALFGGVGAIPGAVLGGLVGLGTGLWNSHEDGVAEEQWRTDMNDPSKVNPNSKEGRAIMDRMERNATEIEAGDKQHKLTGDEIAERAISRTYHNEKKAEMGKQTSEGGGVLGAVGTLWNDLF